MTQKIFSHQLPNGLTLVAEEMPWLESAAFALLTPAGCAYEPADKLGLASLTCEMAQRGAGHGESPASIEAYRRRAARAKASADAVRSILQDNRPVDLAPTHAGARGPGGAADESGEAGNG